MPSPVEVLEFTVVRTALAELVLLGIAGGLLGTWIVLRGLAFFTHAVGTATFPGLVVAHATGFSPQLAGVAVALSYAGGVEGASRRGRAPTEAATGLLLVFALAVGAVLASDVLDSPAGADRLLFGTLFGLDGADIALAAVAAALAAAATVLAGRAWLALAFDPETSRTLGRRGLAADLALVGAVAIAVSAATAAVGALLVSALFVVPAATVRLLAGTLPRLLGGAVLLAVGEAVVGLYVAWWLDVTPGPAIATLGGLVFAGVALWRASRRRQSGPVTGGATT